MEAGAQREMVVASGTEQLVSLRAVPAPLTSHAEPELRAGDGRPSTIPSVCVLVLVVLVELLWVALLLLLGRVLIFA
jgi:hypothetical protein